MHFICLQAGSCSNHCHLTTCAAPSLINGILLLVLEIVNNALISRLFHYSPGKEPLHVEDVQSIVDWKVILC